MTARPARAGREEIELLSSLAYWCGMRKFDPMQGAGEESGIEEKK
jgi:hypothetical protein